MAQRYSDLKLYRKPVFLVFILVLLIMVVYPDPFGAFAFWVPKKRFLLRWMFVMVSIAVFAAVVSEASNGSYRAILIDKRNRMSLSRLQFLGWSLLVISALFAFAMHNAGSGEGLAIAIPMELLVAMGISTVSLVGSPAVLAAKGRRRPDPLEAGTTAAQISATQDAAMKGEVDSDGLSFKSIIVEYESLGDARWVQLFTGDETGTASHVDLGKLQMFFFTFILLITYGSEIAELLTSDGPIKAFPEISEGMNQLLGLTHTGYLANKTVSHSREA